MPNFNSVQLIGHVTRDPEIRATQAGQNLAKFGLAINDSWKSKDGEKHEKVCFVDCTVWGKQADIIGKFVNKGDPLFVHGKLELEQWEAQDGSKRSKHSINVAGFQLLRPKDSATSQKGGESEYGDDSIPF